MADVKAGTTADQAYTIEDLVDHSGGWDWENKHVSQSYIDGSERKGKNVGASDIVEAGSVLICAGPANLADAATSNNGAEGNKGIRIVPIGMVESAQISMNKQINRIFEIGSKISYIIGGRVMGGISLSRVFFDGPSILKALYRGEVTHDNASVHKKYANFASKKGEAYEEFSHIGSGNIAMNLDSAFFDNPIGLCFIFKDGGGGSVGEIYFEECHITSYGMGISANMNTLSESVSIEFTKVTPVVTTGTAAPAQPGQLTDRNLVSAQTEQAQATTTTL